MNEGAISYVTSVTMKVPGGTMNMAYYVVVRTTDDGQIGKTVRQIATWRFVAAVSPL